MQEQTTVKREESISQTLYIVLKRGNLSDNTVFSVKLVVHCIAFFFKLHDSKRFTSVFNIAQTTTGGGGYVAKGSFFLQSPRFWKFTLLN